LEIVDVKLGKIKLAVAQLNLSNSFGKSLKINEYNVSNNSFDEALSLNPRSYALYHSGINLQIIGLTGLAVGYTTLYLSLDSDYITTDEEVNRFLLKVGIIGVGGAALIINGYAKKLRAIKLYNASHKSKLSMSYGIGEVGLVLNF
jgi:hypothetical protein|tara:strand:- start:147 stop:584 length:438 start_codon:yes stop_codon:yes gene_type:complete